jgi:hypothetical protein
MHVAVAWRRPGVAIARYKRVVLSVSVWVFCIGAGALPRRVARLSALRRNSPASLTRQAYFDFYQFVALEGQHGHRGVVSRFDVRPYREVQMPVRTVRNHLF